jgi:hypothetical protein
MPRKKLPYREGDVYLVPLDGGYALGVVARLDGGGGIFSYFFLSPKLPTPAQIQQLRAEDADTLGRLGDLHLIGDGTTRRGGEPPRWRVVGHLDSWDRARWPLPLFFRDTGPRLVHYDENTLEEVSNEPASAEDERRYPEDGLWGARFAEKRLQRLLNERLQRQAAAARKAS